MKRQTCALCGCHSPQDHVEAGWHIYQDIRLAEDFVVCTPCLVKSIKAAARLPAVSEAKAQEHDNDGVRIE